MGDELRFGVRCFLAAFHAITLAFVCGCVFILLFDQSASTTAKYVFGTALVPSLFMLVVFRGLYRIENNTLFLCSLWVRKLELSQVRTMVPFISWVAPWQPQPIGTMLIITKGWLLPFRFYVVRAVDIEEVCRHFHGYKKEVEV